MNKTIDLDDSHEEIEELIRRSIAHEATRHVPPVDLASRTVDAIRAAGDAHSHSKHSRLIRRLKGEGLHAVPRPTRTAKSRVSGSRVPPWIIYGAALPVMLALFLAGTFISDSSERSVPSLIQPSASGSLGVAAVPESAAGNVADSSVGNQVGTVTAQRAIARTIDLSIRVPRGEFDQSWKEAHDVATRQQGFVDTSSYTEETSGSTGNIIMRVPTANLEAAVSDLRRVGSIDRLSRSDNNLAQSISEFDAKIRTLRAEEAQLLELLKRTNQVSEVVEIRARLDALRDELGILENTYRGMQQQVDLATIALAISDAKLGSSGEARSKVEQAFEQAADAFTTTLAGAVLAVGYLGPFAILIALVIVIGRFRRRIT